MAKNKAKDNILNGIGNVRDTEGETIPFLRDTDRLFKQYENLRLRLFKDFNIYFDTQQEKDELRAYIDETFIKLVKEYTIHGNIDFQGYIKMKLTARVEHSFRDKVLKEKYREFTTRDEGFIESQLNKDSRLGINSDLGLIEELVEGVEMTPLESSIFKHLIQEDTQKETVASLRSDGYEASEVRESYKEVQDFLYNRLVSLIDSNRN